MATLHLVASTGRTATSFLAALFDQLPGVAACHEGHRGDDAGPDLLPLINLENFQVYKDATRGPAVVAHKRSADVIAAAAASAGVAVVLDVAYYNAILGEAILAAHPTARMVGIVRDAASFVRSATWLAGEDPMPVGWPALDKPLSNRERFIGMGRLRPTAGEDLAAWPSWSAIERNLWLWRATNARLLAAAERFPDRVTILDFGAFKASPLGFARRGVRGAGARRPRRRRPRCGARRRRRAGPGAGQRACGRLPDCRRGALDTGPARDVLFGGQRHRDQDAAMQALEAQVVEVIRGVLVKHKAAVVVTAASKMGDPVEWDSMAFVEIFVAVSKHFGVEVSDDDAMSFMSVADIVEFVAGRR